MTAEATSENYDENQPGREEDRTDPGSSETMRRADRHARRQAESFAHELKKQFARGAAFEGGKEAFDKIVRLLTDN